ncbi:MAG TPA: hypothetical protein VLG28_18885, partial [Acidimicrobiia bacterium]|nr:hypothetical protein [Acidimicrobiia bacterium]
MTSYSAYYAVNDRPVKFVQLADGGVDCLVLDMQSGRFVPDRSYFAAVAPGSGKDVDQLSPQDFDALVMLQRARLLRTWCERLSAAVTTEEQYLVAALGVTLEPRPLEAEQIYVSGGGAAPNIELWLQPNTLTREALDLALGTARAVPTIPSGDFRSVVYTVTVPSGFYKVSAFADFEGSVQPRATVRKVILR